MPFVRLEHKMRKKKEKKNAFQKRKWREKMGAGGDTLQSSRNVLYS